MELDKNMADPLRTEDYSNSMRFPETSSSPESTRTELEATRSDDALNERPALPERATAKPLGEWPEKAFRRHKYDATAQSVGGHLGNTVRRAKEVPGYMSERMHDLKQRFEVIRGHKGDVTKSVRERASEIADTASQTAKDVRIRADRYAHDSPIQFIAAAAAVGFFVGLLLRMRRDE